MYLVRFMEYTGITAIGHTSHLYNHVCVCNADSCTHPGQVYEGQTVIVHVKNNLTSMSTSIHFHGQHQYLTPWMDGVAFVSQVCTYVCSLDHRSRSKKDPWACVAKVIIAQSVKDDVLLQSWVQFAALVSLKEFAPR